MCRQGLEDVQAFLYCLPLVFTYETRNLRHDPTSDTAVLISQALKWKQPRRIGLGLRSCLILIQIVFRLHAPLDTSP